MAEQKESRIDGFERHGRFVLGIIGTIIGGVILFSITNLAESVGENSSLTKSVNKMSDNVSQMKEVVVRLDERQAQTAEKFQSAIESLNKQLESIEQRQREQDNRIRENSREIDKLDSSGASSTEKTP